MNCPKCKDTNYCKDGVINQRQRYQCKSCNYRYTVTRKSDIRSDEIKRMALSMYLEGLKYRTIAKILQVNYVTVFYWIKEWGVEINKIKSDSMLRTVKIDELHSVVSLKKKTKGYVLLLMDIETGSSILCWDEKKRRIAKKKQKIEVNKK